MLSKYDVNWKCKYNDKRCADVMVYKQQNEVSSTHLAAQTNIHREWCKKTQRVMCSNIKKRYGGIGSVRTERNVQALVTANIHKEDVCSQLGV